MKTIVMDSANKYLVVALYENQKCLASLQEEGNRKQSENAIVYLQKLLQENYLKMSDFDEMVITIGPGSYTGVRVALTIAKTLNATMNIKVKTVSSLKAMAGMKKAISILDARSHKLFLGIYNEGKVIVDDCLINIDEFENYQKQYSDYEIVGDTHLVGIPEKEVDLADHIYTLSTLEKEIENVDGVMLESLEGSKDYQNQQEAQAAYAKADTAKKEKDVLVMRAEERLQKAQEQENRAQTLIAKYKKEIPQQMEEQKIRQQAYREILEEKHFPETAWMELTGTYTKTQVQKWKQDAQNHGRQKAAAESLINSARAAIGEQPKPVLEELEKTSEAAEAAWKESQRVLEQWQEIWRIDQKVCQALKPQMEERSEVMHQYEKINGLYQLLSGNRKNSRMDIETYVQRHYLEQILEAANQRFQDMSAGQFELRMCDIDKAGTGKNRGLDLMVYSAVTGKVREVRTLSGGESFMAALSLALGMADQIQESSAAINLDMMFIDEGFGSLDEHSRDQAVKVLQNMAEGEKLIGIISHVTELKQEIEDQLIVTKDDQGSHTRWQIS